LIRIVIAFNALVFALYKLHPDYLDALWLDPDRVRSGELWRLVSYIFIPSIGAPVFDWFFVVCYLGFLWMVGEGLEHAWGAFKLNAFYFLGMIGTTIAAFFFGGAFSAAMLNASLFFAFARFYPDTVIYLFWLLPVKIKWLAWFSAAQILFGVLVFGNGYRMAVLVSLANFLLFFGAELVHEARHRSTVSTRRRRFEKEAAPADEPLHHCEVCQRSEISDPQLDFRVAKDGHEYCVEHLPGRTPQLS
jgi:hypothetical protein